MRLSPKIIDWKAAYWVVVFCLVHIGGAVAAEQQSCLIISSAEDVLNCIREKHPDLRKAQLERSQNEQLEVVGAQRPNPELDGKFGAVSLSNDASLTTEISLLHTFELGGKRGSRVERARAELKQTDAVIQRFREEVTTVLSGLVRQG